ncbi:hypothetical protein [Sulfurovum mangrovi]|uniref:hypothetical protein n=1 Tax=Sulfurovum mangrovi TaxID=2893889 RepID=UPI001E3F4A56|nr:hypothetical protein [Sulfurovum mangrovi]UFH59853.1 hypothetical protein LN246_03170 [Sulfurovum mangrovi]UFH59904.1 hypothetical protein LN246_03430 [Sulfurovum mangrovi]
MAYQIEYQNGNQPESIGLWNEAISAFEKYIDSFEWGGDTVTIMQVKNNDSRTLIEVHIEGL